MIIAPSARRVLGMVAATAIAIGAVGGPAAAGDTLGYVDDDGLAGPTGCAGSQAVSTSIQDAIDVSGPGDTILVCPGSYPEALDIAGAEHRGLTLRAVEPWTARINPRSSFVGATDDDAIMRVAARRVRVQWLKVVAPTGGACAEASYGVKVDGVRGVIVRANRVVAATAGDTQHGPCGMVMGIAVREGANEALITHNLVRGFKHYGIQVHGSSGVEVARNSVRFWHTLTCAALACVSGSRPAIAPQTAGIRFYQASGRALGNAISSTPGASVQQDMLDSGIRVFQGDPANVFSNNLVRRTVHGILIEDAPFVFVRRNDLVSDTPLGQGIGFIDVVDSYVDENEVHGFVLGITMSSASTDNAITGNDATGNSTVDCRDDTGDTLPSGPAPNLIDNIWADNLGNTDNPAGLCTDVP